MIKIVHIISSLDDGGAEGVLYRLCKYDSKHKHVVISMMHEGKYGPLLRGVGVEVHCLNMPQSRVSLAGLGKLFKLLRKDKPNVVQTWMYHADLIGGVISRLAGVKNVFWNVRNTTLEPGKSKRSTICVVKVCAFVSGLIPKKVVYCAYEARAVHEALGYKKGKAEIIGNGYDLTHFSINSDARVAFRNEIGLSVDENLIGMVGRYDPQKDHGKLIDALGLVINAGYDCKLVLIGRDLDANNQTLIKKIDDNKLTDNVVLLGQRTDIPAVMNGLDLHVLSSSFGEAFPNVLAEAMACATPCVSTEVGDAALIVGETGWIVPPKEEQALADTIMQALEEKQANHQAWSERKASCRNRIVENFSIERMVGAYLQVWAIK
ncbi:glycosyltransferase family 4 protein [Aliidiomarina sanyensis]|uniref:Glycosyl transferase family 1 n=1 Tax=Aliidiomarina sanyensis TaxID=1249555 RepID=A0A432WAZ2_9GAMM|nr:glycosyltransferase [Aliidiomarina sanyensis]RUO27870.1 glycosyl transferase family 1 [Aliidiomarina sanyensis]